MKCFYLAIFFFYISIATFAQPFLQSSIEGTQGKEWIIVNYVDWDIVSFSDHNCGTKSYDGHQGTDFVIRSFKAMDDGIAIYAAAAGVVTFTLDSLYDRETSGDIAKKLGNYIAIMHPNGYYTYYAHMKRYSSQVKIGDRVEAGDIIGYVGSSGNSTDPHLHFELWYDSLYVVDPFAGKCGNSNSAFINPPVYDTTLTVWESGLHLKSDLNLNDLRERITTIIQPYEITPTSDSLLYFWTHMYGLRKDKVLSLKWYNPQDELWFEYSFKLDKDYWYYYYWSFIEHKDLPIGDWIVSLYYDGNKIATQTFKVSELTNTTEIKNPNDCLDYTNCSLQKLRNSSSIDLKIFNINGQLIRPNEDAKLTSGIYILQIRKGNELCVIKKWID